MTEEKSSVGWNPALYIWWNQVWRFAAVNIGLVLAVIIASKGMPIVHKFLFDLTTAYEGSTLIGMIILEFWIHLWAIRKSFADHYSTFTFGVESKTTGRSMLGLDKHLKSDTLVAVWWAQTWRMLLIPGAIIAGGLYSQLSKHPSASNYTHLLDTNLTRLNLYAAFVLSIWATKESLGDKYRTLRFTAKPKTFYK